MRKIIIVTLAVLFAVSNTKAQEVPNPITTAAPFLLIAPDARAGGMGDAGVGLTPDVSSQHWNPAKYVFMEIMPHFWDRGNIHSSLAIEIDS